MPSMRLIDSTWITSAPSAASAPAAIGPAHQAVRSSTRTPASGSSSATDRRRGGRGCAARSSPVCSPRRGAGRGSGGSSSSMRHGRRGILNELVASSTNTLRATNWSHSRMFSPLCTGATGMRSSLARRTISAVGVLRGPGVDDVVPLVPALLAIGLQLLHGSPSMRSARSMSRRKLWNCCAAVGAEADVAVEGRLDRRRLDRAPRRRRSAGCRRSARMYSA